MIAPIKPKEINADTQYFKSRGDVDEFDNPPLFTGEARKKFFCLPKESIETLEMLRSPTSRLGYILQRGYFRAINRFYSPILYNPRDIEYILRKINATEKQVSLSEYALNSFKRHQKIILDEFGYSEFTSEIKKCLKEEVSKLCTKNIKPKEIFVSLLQYLKYKKIEVTTYYVLAEIITLALRDFENTITDKIFQAMTNFF